MSTAATKPDSRCDRAATLLSIETLRARADRDGVVDGSRRRVAAERLRADLEEEAEPAAPVDQASSDAAFAALDAAEAKLATITAEKPRTFEQRRWDQAFDAREGASRCARELDPVRFVRRFPGRAYANRCRLPVDMRARVEAAKSDTDLLAALTPAPAMVSPVWCEAAR